MVLATTYLGSADYYRTLLMADDYQWEAWESFPKQTMRNRCVIRSKGEPIMLSIPVKKVEHKQYTRDVEISYQQKWQHQHWMALVSAYGKTPYWMYYEEFFRPFYDKEWQYLMDYNWALHETIIDLLHGTRPSAPSVCRTTDDWQAQDLESYWGSGLSIMDLLCEKGNEAVLELLKDSHLNNKVNSL